MPDAAPSRESAAGDFSSWLLEVGNASEGGIDVPCGDCTACCTSSQFIHIAPDETEALARIPDDLQFPAPGRPEGTVVLGYDERGHCPMLVGGGCSIYEHRPRTCRSYDCRVFSAAGLEPDDEAKQAITERTRRWRFAHPTAEDHRQHAAVRNAAEFIGANAGRFPDGVIPRDPTQRAVLAVGLHEMFLAVGTAADSSPSVDVVAAAINRMADS